MNDTINLVVSAVKILGKDASEQKRYLMSMGIDDCIDELALEFDESYMLLLSSEKDFSKLSEEQVKILREINCKLEEISSVENLWTFQALHLNLDWKEIRQLANRFIDLHSN